MSRVSQAIRASAAFLLLPLSLLPLYLAVPKIAGGEEISADRQALDPPPLEIPVERLAGWRPLPAAGVPAVPVLAYHGVNGQRDHYSITRRAFEEQMEMLESAGFKTITIAQYIRFMDGDTRGLPERPVLITFDDGRLDSYRGADRILAQHGFSAVMYVIAGYVGEGGDFYLRWDELRRMAASKRWDIQEHAGTLHANVQVDGDQTFGPAYANRRWLEGAGLESYADWRRRVTEDVQWGKRALAEHVPGFVPWSFAVPFGDYGQTQTNDPRIPAYFRRLLAQHFKAVFLTDPPQYTTQQSRRQGLGRIEVHSDTRTSQLYRWLAERQPAQGSG